MAKKYRVDIVSSGKRDVVHIYDTIRRDKPLAAAKWLRDFERQARSLARLPLRYEIIPEILDLGREYRHIIFGNYRILYRVEEDRVLVLRVIHAARLLERALLDPE